MVWGAWVWGLRPPPAPHPSPRETQLVAELGELSQTQAREPVRYALLFAGTVQGVGFRWVNQLLAQARGLTGWVRNLEGGDVDMEVQGPPARIASHLDELHASYAPMRARIFMARAERMPPEHGETGFEVRY